MRTSLQSLIGPPAAKREGTVLAFDGGRVRDPEAAAIVALVAEARRVPPVLMLHRSRCAAEVAAARQLAMYLIHTQLGRTYRDVGRYFRRDRTTIAYACRIVEDLREDPAADAAIQALEEKLAALRGDGR